MELSANSLKSLARCSRLPALTRLSGAADLRVVVRTQGLAGLWVGTEASIYKQVASAEPARLPDGCPSSWAHSVLHAHRALARAVQHASLGTVSAHRGTRMYWTAEQHTTHHENQRSMRRARPRTAPERQPSLRFRLVRINRTLKSPSGPSLPLCPSLPGGSVKSAAVPHRYTQRATVLTYSRVLASTESVHACPCRPRARVTQFSPCTLE
jgi:hypothetical protein